MSDAEGRKQIFVIHTKRKLLNADIKFDKLVQITGGMTGADIADFENAAAMAAVKEHVKNQNEVF